MKSNVRECPFCAETIKAAAVLCRFCGRDLPPFAAPAASTPMGGSAPLGESSAVVPSLQQPEVFDLLTALVEKSLVVYEEDGQSLGRYRLLETVRQYGRDRLLAHGEGETVRGRHRDWFVEQAEQYLQQAWTEQEPYFAFADAEHENLRQALEWSFHGSRGHEEGLRLAGALWLYWFHAGSLTEARSWLEGALAGAPGASGSVRARALTGLGMIAFTDPPVAKQCLEESVALSRETGDELLLLAALNPLGYLYACGGEHARGKALLDEALALSRNHGEQYVAYCDLHSGLYAHLVKEYVEAERLLDQVITHPRTWGSVRLFALAALGEARLELGKYDLARTNFHEALVQARPMHGTLTILKCFCGLARVWLAEGGDAARSARLLGAAAAQRERLGMPQLPTDTEAVERAAAAALVALGEPGFQAVFTQGQAMTLEQAIDYALQIGTPSCTRTDPHC